jgi:hypothetical protein
MIPAGNSDCSEHRIGAGNGISVRWDWIAEYYPGEMSAAVNLYKLTAVFQARRLHRHKPEVALIAPYISFKNSEVSSTYLPWTNIPTARPTRH